MGDETSEASRVVYGFVFHSPLDVLAALPCDTDATLDHGVAADVFLTRQFHPECKSRFQFIFAPLDELKDIKILDAKDGKVADLDVKFFEGLLHEVA